jgi:hypothetical protein
MKGLTPEIIIEIICSYYDIELETLNKIRGGKYIKARHIVAYMIYKYVKDPDNPNKKMPLDQVKEYVAKKDHASVIHSKKYVESQLSYDPVFQREIKDIEEKLTWQQPIPNTPYQELCFLISKRDHYETKITELLKTTKYEKSVQQNSSI